MAPYEVGVCPQGPHGGSPGEGATSFLGGPGAKPNGCVPAPTLDRHRARVFRIGRVGLPRAVRPARPPLGCPQSPQEPRRRPFRVGVALSPTPGSSGAPRALFSNISGALQSLDTGMIYYGGLGEHSGDTTGSPSPGHLQRPRSYPAVLDGSDRADPQKGGPLRLPSSRQRRAPTPSLNGRSLPTSRGRRDGPELFRNCGKYTPTRRPSTERGAERRMGRVAVDELGMGLVRYLAVQAGYTANGKCGIDNRRWLGAV